MQQIIQIATAVYVPILAATAAGFLISLYLSRRNGLSNSKYLEKRVAEVLAKLLYRIGIPIGVANFIRKADLSASAWLAPMIAWMAILLAIALSWQIMKASGKIRPGQTQKSFIILSYLGNTSYLGFPVILLLPQLGAQYFSTAVLYDILGTLPAGYGLGVLIARGALQRNGGTIRAIWNATEEIIKNPTLYAFFIGLYLKSIEIPDGLVGVLDKIAWGSIMIALIVMGMRAHQLPFGGELRLAIQPVIIKTILIPLVIGTGLTILGLDGPERLVLVLQTAMPCAFASLVLAENYDLDIKITVASIFLSFGVFIFMLPVWTWAFTTW
jgi:predicted permease